MATERPREEPRRPIRAPTVREGSGQSPVEQGNTTSRKASVADLNDDGKPDVIVMAWDSRPIILRNTSLPGTISFVEWTLGNTFRGGVDANYGFHAVGFVSDDVDDFPDIFLASKFEADLLFENVASNEQTEGGLPGGQLPKILNETPVAVKGTFSSNPQTDVYLTDPTETFVPGGNAVITVSVVFNPPDTCTKVRLIVDEMINGNWIQKANVEREPPTEIALQFDEVSAERFRFTMIGTGCLDTDPYYLEVLARTDKP